MGKQKNASSSGRQPDCILDITNFGSLLCDSRWKVDNERFSFLADIVIANILSNSSDIKEKTLSYALLSKMVSIKLFDKQRTKMYPFIDRGGFIIEHVTTTEELTSLRTLWLAIFSWNDYDMNVHLTKIISKLIGSLVRVLTSNKYNIDLSYILDILAGIIDTQFIRNELPKSSINSIYTSCLSLIIHPSLNIKASDIIATLLSFEQIDDWNNTFKSLCKEIVKIVKLIDMTLDEIVDTYISQPPISDNNNNKPYKIHFYDSILASLDNLSELKRGLLVQSAISGILSLMKNMLTNGSNSGSMSIDLTICLSIFSTVLGREMDLSNEAKCSIQNVYGLSSNTVFPIMGQIKLSILDLLFEILAYKNSSLYKISYILTETMTSLLLSHDFKYSSEFFSLTLLCIDRVIKCFPLVVANTCVEGSQSSSTGIGYLIDIYALNLVNSICNDGQTLIAAIKDNSMESCTENPKIEELFAKNESKDCIEMITSILTVLKTLLTFCSHTLPKTLRKSLELMSAIMLSTISKGVLSRVPKDKRIKRAPVALIRSEYAIQASALDFALTEILTPYGDGKMSGNIALLRNACQACIFNNEVSGICAQTLLTIDNIVTPSMVSIPSVSSNILAKNVLELSNGGNIINTNMSNRENDKGETIISIGNKRSNTIGLISDNALPPSSIRAKYPEESIGFNSSQSNYTSKRIKVEKNVNIADKSLQSRVDDALKSQVNNLSEDGDNSDIEIPDINS